MLQKKAEDWDNDVDEIQEDGEEFDRRDGAARFLVQMLEMKFGPMDAESRARLDAADFKQILVWSDRMLDASTLAEMFAAA
ncbi:MAG TPA: hypothetical protein VGK45_06280 [Thermoanaerobaculia bacterium]|jgi:hypothetical protein